MFENDFVIKELCHKKHLRCSDQQQMDFSFSAIKENTIGNEIRLPESKTITKMTKDDIFDIKNQNEIESWSGLSKV